MRASIRNHWQGIGTAMACWLVLLGTDSAWAQPVFQKAYCDTQKNTDLWVWIDSYVVSAPDGIDYYSFQTLVGAQHGSFSYDPDWALITYTPDADYEGFDGFTYTIADNLGNRSDPVWVFVYVEPTGSITNLPPVIVGFWDEYVDATHRGFNGHVLDDQDPYGRSVEFGGSLAGQTTTVGYDGQFSLYIQLPSPSGIVSARYLDPWNVYSQDVFACYSSSY